MKKGKQFAFVVLAGLMALTVAFSSGRVWAQEETTTNETETTQTTETEAEPQKTLQERMAERKANMQTKLTSSQQNRIKTRCKAAQGLLNGVSERLKGIEKNRVNLYDKVLDRLNNLVVRVGDQADTTELQAEIKVLEEKIAAFQEDTTAQRQAISDLIATDCAADPAAFRASLEEAKTKRAELQATSKEIRAYINETVKPTLQAIRTELKKDQGEVVN